MLVLLLAAAAACGRGRSASGRLVLMLLLLLLLRLVGLLGRAGSDVLFLRGVRGRAVGRVTMLLECIISLK